MFALSEARKPILETTDAYLQVPIYQQQRTAQTAVLRRVRKLPLPTGSKDFCYHAGVLPVKARQEDRFLPTAGRKLSPMWQAGDRPLRLH